MSDKGDVCWCQWEKRPDGVFAGWLRTHPTVRAEADTQDEMVEALVEAVSEFHDDQEVHLQFDPELRAFDSRERLFSDGFVSLDWNASGRFDLPAEAAFTLGRCNTCWLAQGKRTSEALEFRSLDSTGDGAFCGGEKLGAHIQIVSEDFLKLLRQEEKTGFESRPVLLAKQSGRKFFEIVPTAFIPTVALAGESLRGWVCESCGQRSYYHLGFDILTKVVCRSDLPSPIPPIFFIGDAAAFSLCMHKDRFAQLIERRGTKKIIRDRLAIADENSIIRNPELPTREQRLREG